MDTDGWFFVFIPGRSTPVAAFPEKDSAFAYTGILRAVGVNAMIRYPDA